jgi:hypothetical protein
MLGSMAKFVNDLICYAKMRAEQAEENVGMYEMNEKWNELLSEPPQYAGQAMIDWIQGLEGHLLARQP